MESRAVSNIAPGLLGEVRRTVAGARHHIDHRHAELEFDLVLKGTGSFTIGDRNYALKPGVLIWLVPGQQHRLVRSPGLEMWVASLQPGVIEGERIAQLAKQPLRLLPGQELIDLDRLLSQVAQDSDEPAVYNAGIAYLALRAWRASLDSPVPRARRLHPAVSRALLLMRERGAAQSLSELAAAAGVAAPYLSRLLIEHTGRSFVDWRNRTRIDRFMEGYRPGTNLLEAALEAGFGSYARFNHIFNDMIGCAPSEWIKRADRNEPTGALPDGYGVPASPMLSLRQSWTAVLPLVAPCIGAFLGADFLDRLLIAPVDDAVPARLRFEPLDAALPASECDRLIAVLRRQDPTGAETLARLTEVHDFADTYSRLFAAFDLSPTRLSDGVVALLTALATAANPASDPAVADVRAGRGQVRSVLRRTLPRLEPRAARDIHTALICHVVVAYRALEAARASGDPREFDHLRDAAVRCGNGAFGGDVGQIALASGGFIRRDALHEPRRTGGKRARAGLSR